MERRREGAYAPSLAHRMKRWLVPLCIILFFLAGIGAVLYPLVSNLLYEKNQSHVLAEYDQAVAQQEAQALERELEAAREYNRSLLESEAFLTDPFDPALVLDPTVEPYASLLNLEGDGIMGYVNIPKISVNLPIYHGTTTQVLEKGVGHLQNTSLPVGGKSTHSVLTGHTGLAGKRLFTDLSQLETGNVFYLHILGQTLAYQVTEIFIVEPDDTQHLVVEQGEDLVTLLTCHPYGLNTHRLLVRGSRIPYEEAVEQEQQEQAQPVVSVWEQEYRKSIVLCLAIYAPITLIIILVILLRRRKKRKDSTP